MFTPRVRAAQAALLAPALAALVSSSVVSAISEISTAHAAPVSPGPGLAAPTQATTTPAAPGPRKVIVEPPPPVPDETAVRAAEESNLSVDRPRHGLAAGAFFMGWQQVGSVDDAGRGGGLGLRLGASATPETVVWLELVAGAFPDNTKADCTLSSDRDRCLAYIESNTALVVSAQRYLGPTLWLRGGAGFTTYTQVRRHPIDSGQTREAHGGLAMVGGAGIDLVRRHHTRLSLESMLSLHRFSSGWIFDVGFGFGVALY
jgi:hypothetical protein